MALIGTRREEVLYTYLCKVSPIETSHIPQNDRFAALLSHGFLPARTSVLYHIICAGSMALATWHGAWRVPHFYNCYPMTPLPNNLTTDFYYSIMEASKKTNRRTTKMNESKTDMERVAGMFDKLKEKLSRDQIAVLSTMLYRLDQEYTTKELIERERIKLDSYNTRTAWKKEKLTKGATPSSVLVSR